MLSPRCAALPIQGKQYIVLQAANGDVPKSHVLVHVKGSRVAVGGQHSLTFHSWSIRELSARDTKEHSAGRQNGNVLQRRIQEGI